MNQYERTYVEYTKKDDSKSVRVIVPTFIPENNVKAVDVSNLTAKEGEEIVEALREYGKYVEDKMKSVFSFEDWVNHTQHTITELDPVKWRTFSLARLEVLTKT